MSLQLDNVNFGQELNDTFQQPDSTDLSFEGRRRKTLKQRVKGSIRRLRGIPVYSKTGRRQINFCNRISLFPGD